MKHDRFRFWLCVLFFIALAAITYRCVWGSNLVFSASDMNIGRLAFKKNNLPQLLTGYFTANQVLGSTDYAVTPFHVLLSIFPLTAVANMFYGAMLVLGSASLVWFLRLWNRSWAASIAGALVAFWFNSVLLAPTGHTYKIEVLALSALSLCLIEKALRSGTIRKMTGYSMLVGLTVGAMMMEQQDVALLAGLFLGSYAVFRLVQLHGRALKCWLAVLLPVAVVAVSLSIGMMLKSYKSNIEGAASMQSGAEEKWNFITQWSMVPGEWPDLVAPGWGGWGSSNPEGPYWGRIGQSPEWNSSGQGFRNFKIATNYIGLLAFILAFYGFAQAWKNRKSEDGASSLFWSLAAIVGFLLALGKYSMLYKLFYHLPLVGSIRAPIKLLDNVQICMGIVAAYGLDRLLLSGKASRGSKILWISCAVCGAVMLLAGLKLMAFPSAQLEDFRQMGFGTYAETMVRNMSNAWVHAAVLALFLSGLVFVVWKGLKPAKWAAIGCVALFAVDSLLLTSHYMQAVNIAALKRGNGLINYLKEHQGNERSYFVDQDGIYNQWLASDGPYHGLNLFNIWQMPRMPLEYQQYLSIVGQNQIRLWQLSSIRYVAAPSSIMQQITENPELSKLFRPVLNYQVPTSQGPRPDVLLEFNGSIPRFALFYGWEPVPLNQQCSVLADPSHDVLRTVLVDPDSGLDVQSASSAFESVEASVTKKKAVIQVQTDDPAILRFSQRYEPGWRVFLNGKPAKLLRLDYVCMGISVPPGQHTVEFLCMDGSSRAFTALGVFAVALFGALALIVMRPGRSDANP